MRRINRLSPIFFSNRSTRIWHTCVPANNVGPWCCAVALRATALCVAWCLHTRVQARGCPGVFGSRGTHTVGPQIELVEGEARAKRDLCPQSVVVGLVGLVGLRPTLALRAFSPFGRPNLCISGCLRPATRVARCSLPQALPACGSRLTWVKCCAKHEVGRSPRWRSRETSDLEEPGTQLLKHSTRLTWSAQS